MSDELDEATSDDVSSGGALRQRLEDALAEKRELTARLAQLEAHRLISDQGFDLVSAEDLKDVPLDQLAERAEALQTERLGYAEKVLAKLGGGEPGGAPDEGAIRRVAQLNQVSGEPVRENPMDGVEPGPARLRAAFAAKANKS